MSSRSRTCWGRSRTCWGNALFSTSYLHAYIGIVKPFKCGAAAAELIAVNAFEAFILFEKKKK